MTRLAYLGLVLAMSELADQLYLPLQSPLQLDKLQGQYLASDS